MKKYYLDTCVWRDHYEDRVDKMGKRLGFYASKLFSKLLKEKNIVVFSDLVFYELKKAYSEEEIDVMFRILSLLNLLERVETTKDDWLEAHKLSVERNVSKSDSLHAILARKSKSIIVTRNIKDFKKFIDFIDVKLPEDII